MSAFKSPNYTQTPNDFFSLIPDMSEAELRVTLVMVRYTFGFHREKFKMGINKLADAAGLSRNGAKDGAEAAEKRGTFKRSNPEEQTEAEWELSVEEAETPWSASDHPLHPVTNPSQPVTTTPPPSDPQVGVKESKKKLSKETQAAVLKGGIGWLVAAGEQVDQSVIDDAVLANDARNTFEKVFGFGTLPWSSNDVWTKLEKLVVQGYKDNPGWIAQYVLWRNGDGKYTAFSNRKIRENPQMFIDTGYPEFVASKAYQKLTESTSPAEPKPLETPFTRNLETWKYYERPSFDDIKAAKKSSSEPLT